MFTSLTAAATQQEQTEVGISSLIDTWLLLRDIELGGERNRGLYVLKSRGMAHSNQIREFLLTPRGIDLLDVYSGGNGGVGQVREQMAQSRKADGAEASRVTGAAVSRREHEPSIRPRSEPRPGCG